MVAVAAPASAADYAADPQPSSAPFNRVAKELDPENPTNQVIAFSTNSSNYGNVFTQYGAAGEKIDNLDNKMEVKYYLVNRTCTLGSPRFQLAIDTDGNGTSNGNAFGYLGDQAFGGGCAMNAWTHEDMTNDAPKWDLSQLGGGMTNTWSEMETFLNGTHPNHRVRRASLVEDNYDSPIGGCAFYDNLQMRDRALNRWEDVAAPQNTSLCSGAPPAS
jgi:hypothetical protein